MQTLHSMLASRGRPFSLSVEGVLSSKKAACMLQLNTATAALACKMREKFTRSSDVSLAQGFTGRPLFNVCTSSYLEKLGSIVQCITDKNKALPGL